MNRLSFLTTSAFGVAFILISCDTSQDALPPPLNDEQIENGIAVGFDRTAGLVIWNDGLPSFEIVTTASPVLHFAGYNVSRDALAYTTIDRLVRAGANAREKITREESLDLALEELIPSGELFVERSGGQFKVSGSDEFVVSSKWSPVDSGILAYAYYHDTGVGIRVIDIVNTTTVSEIEDDLIPDSFDWSDDGSHLVYYVNDNLEMDSFGHEQIPSALWRAQAFDLFSGTVAKFYEPRIRQGLVRPSFVNSSMELSLPRGRLLLPRPHGGEQVSYEKYGNPGTTLLLKIDQVRGYNQHGVVYADINDNRLELKAFGGDMFEPATIVPAVSLTYYIPIASGPNVTFTQVGASYSGGGCNVTTHTAASTMKYAIDIQISGSTFDQVVASTTGTVVSFVSNVTCNNLDGTGCSLYQAGASCNSGWGNDVILAHSDGFWTKYTHLENGASFKVTTIGASAGVGCHLADEGGTGASSGTKNGCGDHLHFQRQSSSGLNGMSVPVSFFEDGTINNLDCVLKTPTVGGSSCVL